MPRHLTAPATVPARATLTVAAAVAVSIGTLATPALGAGASHASAAVPASSAQASQRTVTINSNPPKSTYARLTFSTAPGGVRISRLAFTGVMTAKGCYRGVLYRNGAVARRTATHCAAKGKRVTVVWTGIGFAKIGTRFGTDFTGSGSPAGVEAFRVTSG